MRVFCNKCKRTTRFQREAENMIVRVDGIPMSVKGSVMRCIGCKETKINDPYFDATKAVREMGA